MSVLLLNCWVTDTKLTPYLIEQLHEPGEIEKGPAEAVNLIYDDRVDAAGFDRVGI